MVERGLVLNAYLHFGPRPSKCYGFCYGRFAAPISACQTTRKLGSNADTDVYSQRIRAIADIS